jgi:hypothetical protein
MIIYYLALLTVIDGMTLIISTLAGHHVNNATATCPPIVLPRRYTSIATLSDRSDLLIIVSCYVCAFKILVELVASHLDMRKIHVRSLNLARDVI